MFSNIFQRVKNFGVGLLRHINTGASHINRVAKAVRNLPIPVISGIANDIFNISGIVKKGTEDILNIVKPNLPFDSVD